MAVRHDREHAIPIVGLCDMDEWISNLSPWATYLIAASAIMLGAIFLLGGIILLLEPRKMSDSEKLAAIKKVLDRADDSHPAKAARRRARNFEP
jgi:hypothetical protein